MPSSAAPIVIADSITRVAEADARGAVVVNASHGGIYATYLAAKLGAAAAVFNDAGVGRDRAGISGLAYLQELGMPAATIGHDTARIGDGADMLARGVISHANGLAAALGCRAGMSCRNAAAALQSAEPARAAPPPALEGAFLLIPEPPPVWALDSASLVAEHRDAGVVGLEIAGGRDLALRPPCPPGPGARARRRLHDLQRRHLARRSDPPGRTRAAAARNASAIGRWCSVATAVTTSNLSSGANAVRKSPWR